MKQQQEQQHQQDNQKMITNSTCLVTGGAGFIGSNLTHALAKPDYNNKVIVIDNLSTGYLHNISDLLNTKKGEKEEQKIEDNSAISNNNLTFIKADITNLALLQNIFQKYKPNYVFHLAAIASVPKSIIDPLTTHEVNVTGTLNVLLTAKDVGTVKKFVFSSSCAVYGNPSEETLPIRETQPPDPLSPYATSKLMGEYYCNIFSKTYNLSTVALRYFNVYGPRQDPNSEYAAVIPKFINNALNDKPLIIYGNGDQTRDFIFVKDVIQANILATEDEISGVFNIGSEKDISINKLAELITDIHGKEIKIVYSNPQPGDIKYSFADIAKIKRYKFEPEHNLEYSLKKTYEWFECILGNEDLSC